MKRTRRSALILVVTLVSAAAGAGARPAAPPALHGASDGHLPPSSRNVELVGGIRLTTSEASIGDVTARGTHAYVAAWGSACATPDPIYDVLEQVAGPGTIGRPVRTTAQTTLRQVAPQVSEDDLRGGAGVHIVDFSVPQAPVKVGFIPAPANAYVGEGMHVLPIKTKHFTGDLLVANLEPCDYFGGGAGGVALYDVTDPLAPVTLSTGIGDRTATPYASGGAHPSHSAFAWQQGSRAYVVMVDNVEFGYGDVDILDITDPRKPRHIADVGLTDWPRANRLEIGQTGGDARSYHHDVWVKKVGTRWLMLLSYWDSGWIVLDVGNPRRPRFVRDYDYPAWDLLNGGPTEGNAHQAVWTLDNRYIIGASEDYFAKLTYVVGGGGIRQEWFAQSRELPGAPRLTRNGTAMVSGRTTYGGLACGPLGVARAQPAPKGTRRMLVVQEGVCSVAEKVAAAAAAGYDTAIVAASHESSLFGVEAGRVVCPEQSGKVLLTTVCISHSALHSMFGLPPNYVVPAGSYEPEVGRRGDDVMIWTFVDGSWGDLRLIDARTMRQRDQFQIREALSPKYDEGFGWLTVHEIKPDPRARSQIVYASWYSGGMRVISHAKGRLRELGHFISDHGSDYWGVFPVGQASGPPLVLMSDMHYGLEILRYTG